MGDGLNSSIGVWINPKEKHEKKSIAHVRPQLQLSVNVELPGQHLLSPSHTLWTVLLPKNKQKQIRCSLKSKHVKYMQAENLHSQINPTNITTLRWNRLIETNWEFLNYSIMHKNAFELDSKAMQFKWQKGSNYVAHLSGISINIFQNISNNHWLIGVRRGLTVRRERITHENDITTSQPIRIGWIACTQCYDDAVICVTALLSSYLLADCIKQYINKHIL